MLTATKASDRVAPLKEKGGEDMTVAVSCNLPDGVVLGVDSAITVANAQGQVIKVYENAQKLFQLSDSPIGISTFGLGTFGARSIGSYIRQFELEDPATVVSKHGDIKQTVEELRKFFLRHYQQTIIPIIEQQQKIEFKDIPDDKKPVLGLVVGGFSKDAPLSQVWQIVIPFQQTANSARQWRGEGDFGGNWFSLYGPIFRYTKGYDENLPKELKDYIENLRGSPLNPQEESTFNGIFYKHEYKIPFGGMPIDEGVAHVKFLVEMVVNHHRFAIGAPVVGGKAQIGLVTYKGEKFSILKGVQDVATNSTK